MRKKASCQRINRIRTNNSNINLGSGKIMFDLFASHVSIALYIPILRSLFSPSSSFFSLSLSMARWRLEDYRYGFGIQLFIGENALQSHCDTMHPTTDIKLPMDAHFSLRAPVPYLMRPSRGHIALATDLMADGECIAATACTVHSVFLRRMPI